VPLASGPSACWDVGSFGSPFWLDLVAVVGLVPLHVVGLWCCHDPAGITFGLPVFYVQEAGEIGSDVLGEGIKIRDASIFEP
jgi:hypothetical protein